MASSQRQVQLYYCNGNFTFYTASSQYSAARAAVKELSAAARANAWSRRCVELGMIILDRSFGATQDAGDKFHIDAHYRRLHLEANLSSPAHAFALQLKSDELLAKARAASYTADQWKALWNSLVNEVKQGTWKVDGEPVPVGVRRAAADRVCQCTGCAACQEPNTSCGRPMILQTGVYTRCKPCKRRSLEVYASSRGAQIFFPSKRACAALAELQTLEDQKTNLRFSTAKTSSEVETQREAVASLHRLCFDRLCTVVTQSSPAEPSELMAQQ